VSDFAVIADLPLGAYRARTPGGQVDPMPSPARLHAALLCAAATGPRAHLDGEELAPDIADVEMLQWLEQHPPDGVRLPQTSATRSTVYGYRREGTLVKEGGDTGPKDKVVARPLVGLIAVDGPFAWTWTEPPPAPVRDILGELCGDVAYLGNAETPVRLRVGEAHPTHRRAPDADLFTTPSGLDTDVAAPGRTNALRTAHDLTRLPPSAAADKFSSSEAPRAVAYVREGREPARYLSLTADDEPPGPWSTVLLAGFGLPRDRLREVDHVGWAAAVHRALIGLVGDGAPPLLTGAYLPGVARPTNRVALQLLAPDAVRAAGIDSNGPVLAVLLPTSAPDADISVVADAFARLRIVSWGASSRSVTSLPARSARLFWPTDGSGVFEVRPAAVPDTRPVDRNWTIADAVALSLGFVLRDRKALQGAGRGDARHRETARLVREAGLTVHAVNRVMSGDLSRYVHRIDDSRVVQPYRARLSLGGLLDDRTLVCLGQSRHLGGGLLVPVTGAVG